MKRLWNYIEPGKYPVEQHEKDAQSEVEIKPSTSTAGKKQSTDNPNTPGSSRKRKASGDLSTRKLKSRRTSEKQNALAKISEPQIHKQDSKPEISVNLKDFQSPLKGTENDSLVLPASDVVDVSECSNSSW